jgi:hypothetical protein
MESPQLALLQFHQLKFHLILYYVCFVGNAAAKKDVCEAPTLIFLHADHALVWDRSFFGESRSLVFPR